MDSVSSQPVNHALVRLTGNSRAVLTDAEGRFQFADLPAGSVTVLANKPGYLGMDFGGSRSPSMRSVQLPDVHSLTLKLTPESLIVGQVTDEDGAPLEGFSVNVFSRLHETAIPGPNQRPGTLTDDEGKFRIAGLPPGSYILVIRQTQGPIFDSSRKSAAPLGYSLAFYPGVNDSSSAVPLKLSAGKTLQANFSLKREPYVQLSGTVSGFHPQEQVFLALQDSSGASETSDVVFDPATGSFHTKWIPPGVYSLTAETGGNAIVTGQVTQGTPGSVKLVSPEAVSIGGSPHSFGTMHVNATSSLSGLRLALQPTIDIPVLVRGLPPASANSEGLQLISPALALIPKENGFANFNHSVSAESRGNAQSVEDMHLSFAGVVPGTYELAILSPGGGLYAESATWGSTDLLRSDLVLESSGSIPPIEVVLRDDGATLNGSVSSGDSPIPVEVVLLSERFRTPRIVGVSTNGRFEISGLAPGTYRVFAVDSTSGADHTDPSFLQKISTKIQEVALSPKQSSSVDLEVATVEE